MIGQRRQGLQWVRENSMAAPEAPPVSLLLKVKQMWKQANLMQSDLKQANLLKI